MTSAKDTARVIEYLCMKAEGTPAEKTRLNKLLYLVQGYALAILGHKLFPNEIDAWDHGPVVAVVYTNFNRIVEAAEQVGLSGIELTSEEMDLIMDVWEQYRGYTAKELVDMTHKPGAPWSQTYKPGVKNVHIPAELMRQYFEDCKNELSHDMCGLSALPAVDALPAEDYDSDEDSVWEALLHDAD